MSYEIWNKFEMHPGRSLPSAIHYTIDVAIETAKKLSRGTHKIKMWHPKSNSPMDMFDGEYVESEVPNAFCIVERDGATTIRGWALNGRFEFAKDCKRCNNTGDDGLGHPCKSCNGASFKPNI